MRHFELVAAVPSCTAAEAYLMMCNFKEYAQYSQAVRAMDILEEEENRVVLSWEVYFRGGIFRWTEEDLLFPDTYSCQFNQVDGDADYFAGGWDIQDAATGCQIRFSFDFDMGIPSLSSIIDPIAERALRENIESTLFGLLPKPIEILQASGTELT